MSDTEPSMDYGREARQAAPDNPEVGMNYGKVDVANHIEPTDYKTIKIPGRTSEMYPEDTPPDEEVRLSTLPDTVTAEYLKLFNEGKADEAIAAIHQDLIDAGAPEGTLKLAAYLASEYKENEHRPEWRRYAADMTIWLRRAIVARGGKR